MAARYRFKENADWVATLRFDVDLIVSVPEFRYLTFLDHHVQTARAYKACPKTGYFNSLCHSGGFKCLITNCIVRTNFYTPGIRSI